MSDISMAPRRSHQNREVLKGTKLASCYFCLQVFAAKKVTHWTDKGETAVCPHCGVDAVLPRRYPASTLRAISERWFGFRSSP